MKDHNSQENKNMEAQASAVVTMTTEQFHKELEENTRKQNALREERANKLADRYNAYVLTIKEIDDQKDACAAAFRKRKAEFDETSRLYNRAKAAYAKDRNIAGLGYNKDKAGITSEFATRNEQLQSERHDIFERFRNSGGQFMEDVGELLHPEWKRRVKADTPEE